MWDWSCSLRRKQSGGFKVRGVLEQRLAKIDQRSGGVLSYMGSLEGCSASDQIEVRSAQAKHQQTQSRNDVGSFTIGDMGALKRRTPAEACSMCQGYRGCGFSPGELAGEH